MQRLDGVLSSYTCYTRSDVKKRILQGEVLVDGVPVLRPETKVDPTCVRITLCGELLVCAPAYIMMNKPQGVLSATRDPRMKTVLDLVPQALCRKNLFPAGRLDRDTEGFMLLTDDGGFAHHILAPKSHVAKTYLCEVEGVLAQDTARRFTQGMTLEDGSVCRPAGYETVHAGDITQVRVILYEGMYHQIKRMFHCCGGEVTALRREKIGGLSLDKRLASGACRQLSAQEVRQILER